MKFKDWHARQLARDPEYARAIAETSFAQGVADAIVEARIRAGLSQGDLAQRAGTTQARISELERGIGNPTLDTVARVMAALGIAAALAPTIATGPRRERQRPTKTKAGRSKRRPATRRKKRTAGR
jgi:transcriptional regulator with XRE-family HTH domain